MLHAQNSKFVMDLLDALGLKGRSVSRLVIECAMNQAVTVYVMESTEYLDSKFADTGKLIATLKAEREAGNIDVVFVDAIPSGE